ncbi:hypothetical protein BDB00DRAFT_877169 [Zychaea mexicana]|uniref:uncharacterized protein n=1 Tax=Zychaea mexicana TaxID=64656 RepID=UPI0022FE32BF|nr:uncharacterized protein BDB00DRAFT_877169 [Zychaea mexicana]KAI9488699.1 hypothetical protein BDB00DRAFT_877169 [Zychaea mexicana]
MDVEGSNGREGGEDNNLEHELQPAGLENFKVEDYFAFDMPLCLTNFFFPSRLIG